MNTTDSSRGAAEGILEARRRWAEARCYPLLSQGSPAHGLDRVEAFLASLPDLQTGLTDRSAEALGRLITSLLCGEESAVQVFQRAGDGLDERQQALRSALYGIALDEYEHEHMLRGLRQRLPVAEDFLTLRRRAGSFFLQLVSPEPALHFARVSELDSGVCITLSAMLRGTCELSRAPAVARILRRIRGDESRHIKVARQHALALGVGKEKLRELREQVRKGLVELLSGFGDSFEVVKVDPDWLFRRILGVGGECARESLLDP